MNQLILLQPCFWSRVPDAMHPFQGANRQANSQYLELVLTLQSRANAADGIGKILPATVHVKFEENNQHTNMITIMM